MGVEWQVPKERYDQRVKIKQHKQANKNYSCVFLKADEASVGNPISMNIKMFIWTVQTGHTQVRYENKIVDTSFKRSKELGIDLQELEGVWGKYSHNAFYNYLKEWIK